MKFQEIEIDNLTKNTCLNNLHEKAYTAIDSFTISQNNNTITGLIMINRTIAKKTSELPDRDQVAKYFKNPLNLIHMKNRCYLSNLLNVPLFLISATHNFENNQILRIELGKKKIFNFYNKKGDNPDLTFSLQGLQNFIQDLRHEKRKFIKPLVHFNGEDIIKKMSDAGILLGGNLDGFNINEKEIKIVEFSKIGATPKGYDYTGNKTKKYNFQYMKEDYGRWYALETLRKNLEQKKMTKMDIIIWSYINSNIKIFREVVFEGPKSPALKVKYKNIENYSITSTNKINSHCLIP